MKREKVREPVWHKDIFGSLISGEYSDDKLVSVIDWLTKKLAKIPAEHRDAARLEISSVGGYEGEHHAEATIYYDRPETDEEFAARKAEVAEYSARADAAERDMLARLLAKHGAPR